MRVLLIADTHFNHNGIATHCDRPPDFTEILVKNWGMRVEEGDTVIHLGDVGIGRKSDIESILRELPGRKILVRGNHDREKSNRWWMNHGFDFSCDAMMWGNWWLTHEPAKQLPWEEGSSCEGNIHGHLHNIWDGFVKREPQAADVPAFTRLNNPWQRLFAVEYTNYCPIEFQEFVYHCDKYKARGPAFFRR
jgi:calcineurin-like phosphoesterase family protein